MDPELADKFIGMYVNKWTLDYGEEGRRAVKELFARGVAIGLGSFFFPGGVSFRGGLKNCAGSPSGQNF